MKNHKIFFLFSIIITIIMIIVYFVLDDKQEVPIHWDISGNITKYGNKRNLLLMLAVNSIIIVILYFMALNPHNLNYPNKITQENKDKIYKKMQSFLGILSLICSFIFLIIFSVSMGFLKGEYYIKYMILFLFILNPIILIYFIVVKNDNFIR